MVRQTKDLEKKVDALVYETDVTRATVHNTLNHFLILSDKQFIESVNPQLLPICNPQFQRTYEDEETVEQEVDEDGNLVIDGDDASGNKEEEETPETNEEMVARLVPSYKEVS